MDVKDAEHPKILEVRSNRFVLKIFVKTAAKIIIQFVAR